tara:strand:+ start:853 stop:1284 length:432 start_codon:yes stop_codon:yes gene_type:complete
MKTTKQQIKKMLKEEIQADEALLDAILSLGGKINDLDISIDYLSAALTDLDPYDVGYSQATSGRLAKPKKVNNELSESELRDMVIEEIEQMFQEKELTEPEKKEKEKIVKGMKKDKKGFKKRYGDDAESVMYATATKIAKEKK